VSSAIARCWRDLRPSGRAGSIRRKPILLEDWKPLGTGRRSIPQCCPGWPQCPGPSYQRQPLKSRRLGILGICGRSPWNRDIPQPSIPAASPVSSGRAPTAASSPDIRSSAPPLSEATAWPPQGTPVSGAPQSQYEPAAGFPAPLVGVAAITPDWDQSSPSQRLFHLGEKGGSAGRRHTNRAGMSMSAANRPDHGLSARPRWRASPRLSQHRT